MPTIKAVLQNNSQARARKAEGIIARVLGEDFGYGGYKREGDKLDIEDRKSLMIGVLLKMDTASLNTFVNDRRKGRDLEPILVDRRDIYDFRKGYAELIDQAYIAVATYIGDLHPYADKIHRVGLYNDIIEALEDIPSELALGATELTVKKANLLLKTMGALNAEMGDKTLLDFFRPKGKKYSIEDEGKEKTFSKDEVEKLLTEKFSNQLPVATSKKIEFTDYTNCANGESLNGNTICWNDSMCGGSGGKICAVQNGDIQRCPKFLNKTLLEDKEWILRMREKVGLNYRDIAMMCGADKLDDDIKEKLKYYFAKHGIDGSIGFNSGNPKWTGREADSSEAAG